MKLWTINRWLRRVGLVLVVEHPMTDKDREPVKLWVERSSTFDARAARFPIATSTAYPRDLK